MTLLAVAYTVLARLAYVVFVGIALRRQEREQWYTRRWGLEEGFGRFRRAATLIMANDVVAFCVACLATRDTLMVDVSRAAMVAAGALLIVIGVGVKVWATNALGVKAFYWYNFFSPPDGPQPPPGGPYRFLANPMYTLGYVQTYGFALLTASLPGLYCSLFSQLAIIVFYRIVERPHLERLRARLKRA